MNEFGRERLEDVSGAGAEPEIQVEVVDEDDEDPAGHVVGRPRRRQDHTGRPPRRRRRRLVIDAAAVRHQERDDLLLDVILVDLEVVLREIRDELSARIADDDVRRDDVDLAANHLAGRGRLCRRLRIEHGRRERHGRSGKRQSQPDRRSHEASMRATEDEGVLENSPLRINDLAKR